MRAQWQCRADIRHGLCLSRARHLESAQGKNMRLRNGRGQNRNITVRMEAYMHTQASRRINPGQWHCLGRSRSISNIDLTMKYPMKL